MIKDCYITTFGVIAYRDIDLDIGLCPRCRKKVVARITKEVKNGRFQIGLKCPECEYKTRKDISGIDFEKATKEAVEAWNNDSRIAYLEEKLYGLTPKSE